MSELIQAVLDSEKKAICAHFSVICAIKKSGTTAKRDPKLMQTTASNTRSLKSFTNPPSWEN